MSKKTNWKDVSTELGYELEAAENEIENLKEQIAEKHRKLWDVIQENDRLTMTYEPYRPDDDKDADKDFYGLITENDSLTKNILDKMEVIKELDEEVNQLTKRTIGLQADLTYYKNRLSETEEKLKEMRPRKMKKAGVISFDFWPVRDWWRLTYHKWDPGKAAQLCVGPIRVDWFAD